MKKIALLLSLVIVLASSGCSREESHLNDGMRGGCCCCCGGMGQAGVGVKSLAVGHFGTVSTTVAAPPKDHNDPINVTMMPSGAGIPGNPIIVTFYEDFPPTQVKLQYKIEAGTLCDAPLVNGKWLIPGVATPTTYHLQVTRTDGASFLGQAGDPNDPNAGFYTRTYRDNIGNAYLTIIDAGLATP